MDFDPDNLEKGFEPGNEDWIPPKASDMADGEKRLVSVGEMLATFLSRVVLASLLFVAFIAGVWVGGVALHDPDTCWLLATGRWIFENHQIPVTDPFSWTFAALEAGKGIAQAVVPRHLICYQWLTELIYYLATLPSGFVSLLILCAVTIVTAFLSIPMGLAVTRQASFIKSALVVLLGMTAASFHTLARPEIFSYLLLAFYLQVTHGAREKTLRRTGKLFPLALILAPLMVLWANMHTGFVTGFAVMGALTLGSFIAFVIFKAPVKELFVGSLIALLASFVGGCINPYGLNLYGYIPELFNNPINQFIEELKPVLGPGFKVVGELIPFLILCVVYAILMVRETVLFVKIRQTAEKLYYGRLGTELLICFLSGSIAIYNGMAHRRVASFVTLILVAEIIALLGLARKEAAVAIPDPAPESEPETKQPEKKGFWSMLDSFTLDLWQSGGGFEIAIVALCAIAGVTLVAFRISPPTLPQDSVFKPPFKAIDYLGTHPQSGKLFNDSQYGSMLDYYKPGNIAGNPKVFIDTRYDMFGYDLGHDYMVIHDGEPGWQKLLSDYKIDWVFVPVKCELAQNLKKDGRWTILYEDEKAIIMRNGPSKSSDKSSEINGIDLDFGAK